MVYMILIKIGEGNYAFFVNIKKKINAALTVDKNTCV